MKLILSLFLFVCIHLSAFGQIRTIHVFVALCDNVNQGIVPVPAKLGNGKDPRNNLYWGAMYGIKSFFKYKASEWIVVKTIKSNRQEILDGVLFKHKTKAVYMLAQAYDGAQIEKCINDFLKAANHQNTVTIQYDSISLNFGGKADLVSYIGHDGLMEFSSNVTYKNTNKKNKDTIILACISKDYFKEDIKNAQAKPLLWTSGLMAPEAYTLKAAIDGWILNETDEQIKERAAQAYNQYQKCGIKGARNLFRTGF